MASHLSLLRDKYTSLMGWGDDEKFSVDFIAASYLSRFMQGAVQASWGDLIGPSSGGKGELLLPYEDYPRTIRMDRPTENAFSSAFRDDKDPDKDPSILASLSHAKSPVGPKVIVIPELTPLLQQHTSKGRRFFDDLRAAYDGKYSLHAGNLGRVEYKDIGFGLVIGCTPVLDDFRKMDNSLGSRTVTYRLWRRASSYSVRRRIATHAATIPRLGKPKLQEDIRDIVHQMLDETIDTLFENKKKVTRSPALVERLSALSTLVTSFRCSPTRQSSLDTAEMPPRVQQQFEAWGDGRVLLDGRIKWEEEDYNLVCRICQDTITPTSYSLLKAIWRDGPDSATKSMPVNVIAAKSKQTSPTFQRQLDQWVAIDILHKYDAGSYGFNPDVAADVHLTGIL